MKDTRTGAGRQKPVKGAVDKAGKGNMPKPAVRQAKQDKAPKYGPAARAAEARKEIRAQEKGKAPRGEAAPVKAPAPAPKAQAARPASRPKGKERPVLARGTAAPVKAPAPAPKAQASRSASRPESKRQAARPEGRTKAVGTPKSAAKGPAPRGRAVGSGPKRIPPSTPVTAGPTPTPAPPSPPQADYVPPRTYTPAQMNAMNNDRRFYTGRLPMGIGVQQTNAGYNPGFPTF